MSTKHGQKNNKLLTITLILALTLTSCGNKALKEVSSTETSETVTSQTNSAISSEEISIEVSSESKYREVTYAGQGDALSDFSSYKYQPPKEITDTHFRDNDIVAKIKFNYLSESEYSWDHPDYDIKNSLDISDFREKISNEHYKYYPKYIVDDLNKQIVDESDEDKWYNDERNQIIRMGDMQYDMNGDGIKDYIIHASFSIDGSINEANEIYMIYIVLEDGSYKAVEIPLIYFFQHEHMSILSTKTNGLNDLKILEKGQINANYYKGDGDIIYYNGDDEYPEHESHSAIRPKNQAGELEARIDHVLLEYSDRRFVQGQMIAYAEFIPDDPHYYAFVFNDNPYLKEAVYYTSYRNGSPKIMNGKDKTVCYDEPTGWVAGPLIKYEFYMELKDGVEIPDDYYFNADQIKYIPIE